jgi:hypothetical protein
LLLIPCRCSKWLPSIRPRLAGKPFAARGDMIAGEVVLRAANAAANSLLNLENSLL